MTLKKRHHSIETVKRSVVAKSLENKDGWTGEVQIFQGSKTSLNDAVMVGSWHNAFVKHHKIVPHKELKLM